METYNELRERQQKEFNESHLLGFAFGSKQFEELMSGWGLDAKNEEDLEKVVHVYAGGYILKENIPAYEAMKKRHTEEMEAAVAADRTGDGFIKAMFETELNNHEYSVTEDPEDALLALGLDYEDLVGDERLMHGFTEAVNAIHDWASKHGF